MTRLVGLGGDCQVAYQIRRADPNRERHFFDSLVTPLASLVTLLANRFDRLLEPEWLAPQWKDAELEKVTDGRYDIWHLHEIGRFEPDDVDRLREKYAYLRDKFLALLGDDAPATFVRRWHPIDGVPNQEAARRLLAALQRIKPSAELLYLHDRADWPAVVDGAYRSFYLRPHPSDWRGDNDAWSEIFRPA